MIRCVLQTNLPGEHHLWLVGPRGVIRHVQHRHSHHGADQLLAEMVALIGRQKIGAIAVVRGPGPFTAVRAALVVTNTLGWLWNIPVLGVIRKDIVQPEKLSPSIWGSKKTFTHPVRPWYGRQPNITKPKKRRYRAGA